MSSRILRGGNSPSTEQWLVSQPANHRADESYEEQKHEELLQQQNRRIAQLERQLAETEAELPIRIDQARQTGFREGDAAGTAKAQAALEAVLQKLARSIAEVAGFRSLYRRDSEQEMLKLSLAVARKVLHRELTIDPQALHGVVKAAIESINAGELYRIRLAPADAVVLDKQIRAMGLPQAVEVIPDSTLERGAVVFETVRGLVDAGIQTQLGEIERGFADLIEGAR